METVSDFIKKVDRLYLNEVDGNVLSKENWELFYTTKLMSSFVDTMAVQIVVHLKYDGQVVKSWYCMDDNENRIFVRWFIAKKAQVQSDQLKDDDIRRDYASKLFDEL